MSEVQVLHVADSSGGVPFRAWRLAPQRLNCIGQEGVERGSAGLACLPAADVCRFGALRCFLKSPNGREVSARKHGVLGHRSDWGPTWSRQRSDVNPTQTRRRSDTLSGWLYDRVLGGVFASYVSRLQGPHIWSCATAAGEPDRRPLLSRDGCSS